MVETTVRYANVTEEAIRTWLKNRLSEDRFMHSLGAQQKAIELARNFKFDQDVIEKAGMGGLLHDAAKLMTPQELLEACNTFDVPVTEDEKRSPQTLHPFVGAEMVKWEFGITEPDIINAIRYHTTGRAGMTPVEKLVFIADKIEGNTRNPLYIQKITALMNYRDSQTLDKVMLYILDSTITFLIEKRQIIHPRTIEARNDMVQSIKAHNRENLNQ